ncbi:MAG: hypothetical protein ACK4PC_00650 [Sphingopyxis sp.]
MHIDKDVLIGSHRMLEELRRSTEQLETPSLNLASLRSPPTRFMGIEFCPSPHFPVTAECKHCAGTGEGGEEATYCEKCQGRGGYKFEGWIQDRGIQTLIRSRDALPPKFAPYFPREIPLHRGPAARSRDIPWPSVGDRG